jgi:hypothetical protein
MKNLLLIALFGLTLIACKKNKNNSALYNVKVNLNWNSTNSQTDYPENAHFSKLIGWSHSLDSEFMSVGSKATVGIKNMAETGNNEELEKEINERIESNEFLELIIGSGLTTGIGDIETEINVNKEYSAVTFASMIAPSPDWYVAAVNVNLLEDNSFVDQKTVELVVYDAGTDSGSTYTSTNSPTNPAADIYKFVDEPLGNGTSIPYSIGTIEFLKQ